MEPDATVYLSPKRPADDLTHADPTPLKKPRSAGLKKKVAEIVLLLSAMAEMRGGRSPTRPELDLMAEARARLVEVCESTLMPKDLVSKDTVEALIDDMGLDSKLKEQKVGVGATKLSISDKLLQTKKKMEEEAKEFNAKLAISGNTVAASSIGHVHGSISGSSVYPVTSNNGKPHLISGVLNQTGKTSPFSLPGGVRPHYGGPRPVSAGSSFDHGQKNTSAWSVQPQTLSFSRFGNDKMSTTSRSEDIVSRITPLATNQPPRTFGSHIPTHQSLQETTSGQVAPIIGNHNEISETVYTLLQKQVPERPIWTPPSRDYMSKPVMCQVCHYSVNDVESVFLCDACEHAYHFRCLPSSNQKAVPRGEWHCPKCLLLSNGKPLPPKYGRVTRNVTASKVSSKVAGFQTSSVQKANMPKVRVVNPPAGITGTIPNSARFPDRSEVQGITSNKPYSEANLVKNPNQSAVIGGPVVGATYIISAQDLKASSLQGKSMADAKPSSVVKMTDVANSVPECEQPSSGVSIGEHSAKLNDEIPNTACTNSAGNDLVIPDSVGKLSDPENFTCSSQQSSDNLPNPVCRLPESDTSILEESLDNVTSATQLTTAVRETSNLQDKNEPSSLKEEIETLSPRINTCVLEDNLSSLGEDQSSKPVNEEK